MNRKSMAKIGAIGIITIIFLVLLFLLILPFFSSAILDKEVYVLGEKIKFNMRNMGDYEVRIKITTPSTSFVRVGTNDIFIFEPEETGDYIVELWRGGGKEEYYFKVIDEGIIPEQSTNQTENNTCQPTEPIEYPDDLPFGHDAIKIGESVNWSEERQIQTTVRTKIRIPDAAENVKVYSVDASGKQEIDFEVKDPLIGEILDVITRKYEKEVILGGVSGRILVEYATEGPKKQETKINERTKEIKISSPEGVHYENVLASADIEEVSSLHFIKVYWKEGDKYVDFKSYDLNQDGLVDRIEWIVPHLSEQTFEIIIITKAEHLDSNRDFIEDVYANVSVKDNVWQEIPSGDYVRVSFEKNLTNGNDITLYAKGSGTVSVYEKDSTEKILELNVNGEGWYTEYFQDYLFQDTFDLLVNGDVDFDYIVDPTTTNSPSSYIDSGSAWTGETGGYADGSGYAEANAQNKILDYYDYDFSIPVGSIINSVMLRADHYAADGNDYITVQVSWDGGSSWSTETSLTASSTERTDWTNVTDETAWTVDKLNNTNFRVRIKTYNSGKPGSYWRVDWAPVEVIYTLGVSDRSVTLNQLVNYANLSYYPISFNYTPVSSGTFVNCSLWDNSSGGFQPQVYNQSAVVNGTDNFINKTYTSDGNYIWNVYCCDGSGCDFYFENWTFTIDTTEPIINLVDPPDNNFSDSIYGVVFTYNVTDLKGIANCSLVIDGSIVSTDDTISKAINQNFSYLLPNGLHNWSVNCTDASGNENASETRTINISIPSQEWDDRWYETSSGTNNYTSTANINLANTRDGDANQVSFSIPSAQLGNVIDAYSPYMGGSGAFLGAGTVSFSAPVDVAQANQGHITWKLYISNSSGDTLICQHGNDITTGTTEITSKTGTTWSGSCTNSQDRKLESTDRIRLVMNIYNEWSQILAITHYWDDSHLSYVDFGNFSSLGDLYADLFAPTTNLNINTGEEFNMSCEVNCSIGECIGTYVYVQYNTSSSDWVNISNTGNLILASGETNGHSLGNVNTTKVYTNFSIEGNLASTNNIRCIAVSDYSVDEGDITKQVRVSAANQPPNVTLTEPNNTYWHNESNIVLYYNASDDGDLDNCSLYLNNQFNQTNSSGLLNGDINNFTIDLIAQGEYNWSIQCFDTTSLSNWSDNRTFYIDTGFPTIELNYPEIDAIVYKSIVDFNLTATDNMVENLTCNLTVDGGVVDAEFNATNGTMINRTIGSLGIGDHLWNVTCWDLAGNLNVSETRNFTITDLPPNVSLTEPNNTYWHDEPNITLFYNASDNNDLANCSLYLNNQFNQSNGSTILNGEINNFTIGAIADGEYNWTINCTDDEGLNSSSETWIFYIDTGFPEISLNAPGNNNISLSSNVSFNFTATDHMDNNLTCNLTINSETVDEFNASNGTLTNRLITDLTDGEKIWNITCWDNAGNINTSEIWSLNVTEYPSITLNTADNESFNYTNIYLNYTPSDNTNLSNCSLYLNGFFNQSNTTDILNGQMNYFNLIVGSGYYNWSVVCVDYALLFNWSENRTFIVDLAYPSINLSYPQPNETIYDSIVYFNYTATDDLDSNIECNLTVNNTVVNYTIASNGSLISIPVTFTESGFKIWNVTCWDDSGNLNVSETRNFTIYIPPNVTLTWPDDNYWFNESTVDLFYEVSDDNDDIIEASLILNGELNESNSTPVINDAQNSITIDLIADGEYNWTINVTDAQGLIGTDQERRFFVDTGNPGISLNYPPNDTIFTDNNLTFNFTVIDNMADNLTCNVTILDDVDASLRNLNITNGSESIVHVLRPDGDYNWSVECRDYAGNYNLSFTRNFTVIAPPNITINFPDDDYWTNESDITFLYTPYDAYGLSLCELYIDDQYNSSDGELDNGQQNQFPVYNFAEGTHNWTINCTDPEGNMEVTIVRTFTIDLTAPNINLTAPLNDSGIDFNQGNVSFQWNMTDVDQQIVCNLTVDDTREKTSLPVTPGEFYSTNVNGLGEGEHFWNVSCWDRAGNRNTSITWEFNFTYPDFFINITYFEFNTTSPAEDDLVFINATIKNLGGADVDHFNVSFWDGHPSSGGTQINGNKSLNILKYGSTEANVVWTADKGDSEVFVFIDPPTATNGVLNEWNESNNEASRNITVGSWFISYGNITSESVYVLDEEENGRVIQWLADDDYSGSVLVADYESIISWADLQAMGKDIADIDTGNDFTDIDTLLGMSGYTDSVYNVYTHAGVIDTQDTFVIFQKSIDEVPVANSTNNTNFVTGILWDMDDDDVDGEYSQDDGEDLVFAAKVNTNSDGAYGNYDYEIRVPAALRNYKGADSEVVYYVELY